jgi:hypothetical protein
MTVTFDSLRWPGWEEEVESLDPDQGIALYPPPFSVEGRDPSKVSRRAVPIAELFGFYEDAAAQLGWARGRRHERNPPVNSST